MVSDDREWLEVLRHIFYCEQAMASPYLVLLKICEAILFAFLSLFFSSSPTFGNSQSDLNLFNHLIPFMRYSLHFQILMSFWAINCGFRRGISLKLMYFHFVHRSHLLSIEQIMMNWVDRKIIYRQVILYLLAFGQFEE